MTQIQFHIQEPHDTVKVDIQELQYMKQNYIQELHNTDMVHIQELHYMTETVDKIVIQYSLYMIQIHDKK